MQAIIDSHPGDPQACSTSAVAFTEDGMIDEYRGCTFVKRGRPRIRPPDPVRTMAVEQRRWVNATAQTLLCEAGHGEIQSRRRGY